MSILMIAYTAQDNTGKKTLPQLIAEDKSLNATATGTWGKITEFLKSGDLQKGAAVLNRTESYIQARKLWLQQIKEFSSRQDTLVDKSSYKKRKEELKNTENMHTALKNIHFTSNHCVEVENLKENFYNLSNEFNETFEYDIGVNSLKVTKQYLAFLESINESIYTIEQGIILQNPKDTLNSNWIDNFPCVEDSESYIGSTRESLEEQTSIISRIEAEFVFRDYIDPIIYISILSTGLVWNVMLLIMFARKKDIRTAPNIMIFNIVMGDVMNLIFNLPLQYFGYYYPQYVRLSVPVCVLFVTLRCMFTSGSALSVVALSAQRFCATWPAFHNLRARSNLSSLTITIIYILLVWAAASSIVLPDTLGDQVCDDKPIGKSGRKSAKIVTLHEFLIYCFVLPGLMFVFTVMTARRLRRSAKEMPGEARHKVHEDARNRGARVVTALCIVFTISYVPFFMWGRIATCLNLDRFLTPYKTLDNITYYLLFSNPCFNPLALYVTSNTFRKHFNEYMFGWYKKHRALNRTDTQISDETTLSTPNQQESDI